MLKDFQEDTIWDTPFVTPMIEDGFEFVTETVIGGHTGGMIYAPTRTGKSFFLKVVSSQVKSMNGKRGNKIESESVAIDTYDRLVMSEGGFWDWQLRQFQHLCAGKKESPSNKRHLVYEFVKGLACKAPSGRLVLFVDEAQALSLVELGWFADEFNALGKFGLKLVLFLVGSYHLQEWKGDLKGKKHAHVRSRFCTKEYRLRGLKDVTDFRRCLRRYDVDASLTEGRIPISEYYHPDWFRDGGRLEAYAGSLRSAFGDACGANGSFEVPMGYFSLAVRAILDRKNFKLNDGILKAVVQGTGFAENYELE